MPGPLGSIERRVPGVPTLEGAGARLRRSFSNHGIPLFDPFLLLDRSGSSNPEDYLAGFAWHPHRGVEPVTYVLDGRVEPMAAHEFQFSHIEKAFGVRTAKRTGSASP